MNKKLLDALENCLQRMQQGESLDSVLTIYPGLAAQLRPLLETAERARSLNQADLPSTVLARQRSRGLALAANLRQGKKPHSLQMHSWRLVMTVLSVIAILVMSSNGLLIASAHSLPGDTLYPMKRSVESTQLHLVSNPAERELLERAFDERRVDETRSLIADERVEKVDFTGTVSGKLDNGWLVSGIPVIISARTDMDDGIGIGDQVEVQGLTNAFGGVNARRLSLVNNSATNEQHPRVSPTPTPSPAQSGEDGNQAGVGNDQSSARSQDSRSSDESSHPSQPDSGGGGD